MNKTAISGMEKTTYFTTTIKNEGNSPQVYYDCFGQPVYIDPGQTGTVMRAKKEFTKGADTPAEEPSPAPPKQPKGKDSVDGEKPKQPKGKNS